MRICTGKVSRGFSYIFPSFILTASLVGLYSYSCLSDFRRTSSPLSPLTKCVHEDYFDETEWKEAIRQNVGFHDRGGNLKSVQLFKDSAIDTTTEAFGLTFIDEKQKQQRAKPSEFLNKYYSENYDPRGGYGKPLPGKWDKEGSKTLIGKRWFDVLEPTNGRLRWDAGLGPIGPKCQNLMQLGDTKGGDGYKFYCLPRMSTSNQTRNDCHFLSVGGNDNWKFEIAVVEQLGCTTHTFDCTLPGGQPKKKPNHPNMHFYNYCIDGETRTDAHGRSYLSYADMLHKAGIQTAPSFFKIDVEGFEYDIFHQMIIQSPKLLPTQIQVELHWATRMTGIPWMMRTRTSAEIALFSSMMYHAGYLPILLDFTSYCSSCMEVLYFRSQCGTTGRSFDE